jgi:type II secretory pathway predicted ATPase ExeA
MYNEFYGFSEKPFELTPNPRFLFLTPSHQAALTSMINGIRERRRLISITGEVGIGKTTLVHSLLHSLDEKVRTVLIFHTTITFKELLKTILQELELEVIEESKAGLLYQLVNYLTQMATRDETLAIIIDEAQNLAKEVMQELQIFSNMKPKLIQILFVGQPEFEDKLNSEDLRQLKQSIEIRRQIRAFSEEESKEYIDHRLRLVGSSSSAIFTQKAISMICSYAQGIPRVINILCDNAFLIGYSLSIKMTNVDIIREVIKELEGPAPEKTTIFSSSVPLFNESLRSFLRLNSFAKKASFAILFLICLGGTIVLTHRYLQQKSAKLWDIKSLKSNDVDAGPSSMSTSPQTKTGELSGKDIPHPLGEIEPVPSQFIKPGSLPAVSHYGPIEEDKSKALIDVERGQTLSYLTKKYYGMVNETLMDYILELNPEITNVHLIVVNQKIKIPKITEELLIIHSSEHTYKIFVGTFSTPGLARLYRDEPVLKGKKIETIARKVSPQDTWYRVMIGDFDHKNEALGMIDLLKKKGLLPSFGGLPKIE